MTASVEQIRTGRNESFYIGVFQDNLDKCTWHYHNHYEISFITEGSGKRIVADSIQDFYPGDLVFIGRNLPHTWIADKGTWIPSGRTLEMVFLQFNADMMSPHILSMPEFSCVAKALNLSERGLRIVDDTLNQVSEIMLQLPYLKDFERMIGFLRLMDIIGRSENLIPLATKEYRNKLSRPNNKRIAMIHEYLMQHYRDEINLQKLAQLVNMAEGSLCRFFKTTMGITLFDYLNQIKTEFACKLLMDHDLSITEVCLDSGFNNLSHFNKQFRKNTGMTPSAYRKQFSSLS